MAEGDDVDPQQLASASLQAFNTYGPGAADVYKNSFIPLNRALADENFRNFQTYGQVMNDMGRNISESNARSQANLDREMLQNPNAVNSIRAIDRLQRQVDPEYYSGRKTTEQGLQNLFGGINRIKDQALLPETGNVLSGSEQAEIERGLNRMNSGAGNAYTPNQQTLITNAMGFGQAGQNRMMANRNENRTSQAFKPSLLGSALGAASGALPTFRSGIDPYKVVTGKASTSQFGTAPVSQTSTGNDFGSQVFGGFNQNSQIANTNSMNGKTSTAEMLPSYS